MKTVEHISDVASPGYPPPPGRMAGAMFAFLKEGANSRGLSLQFSALGQPLPYDFINTKVAILGEGANFRGAKFAILGVEANDNGGICPGRGVASVRNKHLLLPFPPP